MALRKTSLKPIVTSQQKVEQVATAKKEYNATRTYAQRLKAVTDDPTPPKSVGEAFTKTGKQIGAMLGRGLGVAAITPLDTALSIAEVVGEDFLYDKDGFVGGLASDARRWVDTTGYGFEAEEAESAEVIAQQFGEFSEKKTGSGILGNIAEYGLKGLIVSPILGPLIRRGAVAYKSLKPPKANAVYASYEKSYSNLPTETVQGIIDKRVAAQVKKTGESTEDVYKSLPKNYQLRRSIDQTLKRAEENTQKYLKSTKYIDSAARKNDLEAVIAYNRELVDEGLAITLGQRWLGA